MAAVMHDPDGSFHLAYYSTTLKAGLKNTGFACVFVAAWRAPGAVSVMPLNLGEGGDQAFSADVAGPDLVHDAMWVPDHGMATMIAQPVLASITPHRKAGLARFAGGISNGRGQSYELPTLPGGGDGAA
jgi:hypothetical protein